MAFKKIKHSEFNYSSPKEMYQDNKNKKILGPLDYQSQIIDQYMEIINKENIAFELPTGSGKTLVGLLIGTFRRRKNKERVIYLCPTNQLVHQVVAQAENKYGLKATAFCGKQKDYSKKNFALFSNSETIAVTTYSSFFAKNSVFKDVDIIIMDDVHSSEDYLVSNWELKINRYNDDLLFKNLIEFFKPYVSSYNYDILNSTNPSSEDNKWCDMIPMPLVFEKIDNLKSLIKTYIEDKKDSNYYSFNRISENIEECNIFISYNEFIIRPFITPTLTFASFQNAKQKIIMSATLGRSGELERITGLPNIETLDTVNNWDKNAVGRKFFTFPDLYLEREEVNSTIIKLHKLFKKSVFLVPTKKSAKKFDDFMTKNIKNIKIFFANDIESTKEEFIKEKNASIILANRFDGIDFPDDECRLLFIFNLPKVTNLQESFLIKKMSSSKLYSERIRTRIIQAVGRCSRNASDYSLVCIIGNTIKNDLTKQDKLNEFPPELRAEIFFGLENSKHDNEDEILENARYFFNRTQEWQEAEIEIVNQRDKYISSKNNNNEQKIIEKLKTISEKEVLVQYDLWNKNYQKAFNRIENIISNLDAPSLSGYKNFWNYVSGTISFYLYKQGNEIYKNISINKFKQILSGNTTIKWIPNMINQIFDTNESLSINNDYFADIIEKIEENFIAFNNIKKLEKHIKNILENLKKDGKNFEKGHNDLGNLLGYKSTNPNRDGAPDPYWILNQKNIIVSEDKIYEEKDNIKAIPKKHIIQASSHKTWIKEVEKITSDTHIITIFITNSEKLKKVAKTYAEDIYYLKRDDFLNWAIKATSSIKEIYKTFNEEGNSEWRNNAHNVFIENQITPKDFLELVTKKRVKELPIE